MSAFDALLDESLSPARVAYDMAGRAWEDWFAANALPTNAALDARLADPATRAGFVAVCRARGIFHLPTAECVAALVAVLRRLPGPYIEIGAGQGDLARAVRTAGVPLIAADDGSWWPEGLPDDVTRCDVETALSRYQPGTVLCIWPPRGTNWPAQLRACPSVQAYIVVGADPRSMTGDAETWAGAPGWRRAWLPRLAACARCRLDADGGRHTRALLVRRRPPLPTSPPPSGREELH